MSSSNFQKFCALRDELFYTEDRNDGHTTKKKLMIAFLKFAMAPEIKKNEMGLRNSIILKTLHFSNTVFFLIFTH
jgi:hypothetical protein